MAEHTEYFWFHTSVVSIVAIHNAQAGAFHIIMDNDKGETVVLPTKSIADKEIIIKSGPQPEIPEKKVERMTEGVDRQSKHKQ